MNRWKSERIQYFPRISEYHEKLPNWPLDDIIYFTGMARLRDIDLYVDNSHWYGWFPYPIQELVSTGSTLILLLGPRSGPTDTSKGRAAAL